MDIISYVFPSLVFRPSEEWCGRSAIHRHNETQIFLLKLWSIETLGLSHQELNQQKVLLLANEPFLNCKTHFVVPCFK